MNAKEHYENHLAKIYSWMAGDFETRQKEFSDFLKEQHIFPASTKVAIDLGAGDGAQSAALANAGYKVWAVDSSTTLLEELKTNCGGLEITPVEQDMRLVTKHEDLNPEVLVCWGDTLTHLENESDIERFIDYSCDILKAGGKFILSFRDYSEKRVGNERFIPVKSDTTRIMTCFLDYSPTHVVVSDLIYEFDGSTWHQKVSSYNKFRISAEDVKEMLENNNMTILHANEKDGFVTFVATK
ncbi:SAM-dependent methyltransferase [Sphingobacteriaceae bacterium]|nr:SAM-dependent methyltransferase [Sphingobacteriaceae bacterium]